jgi:hypothetical protein
MSGLMQPGPTLYEAEQQRKKRGSMGLLGEIGEPLSYAPGPVGLLGNALLSAQYATGEKPMDEGLSALAMLTAMMRGTRLGGAVSHVVDPKDQERIARYAEKMGLATRQSGSGISQSRYVEVDGPQGTLKVRVSDHDLPRSFERNYGNVGVFEVGSGSGADRAAAAGGWKDAVRWLSEQTGKPLPSSFSGSEKAAATRAAKQQAGYEARLIAAQEQKAEAARRAVADGTAVLQRTNGGYWLRHANGDVIANANRNIVPAEIKQGSDADLMMFLLDRMR